MKDDRTGQDGLPETERTRIEALADRAQKDWSNPWQTPRKSHPETCPYRRDALNACTCRGAYDAAIAREVAAYRAAHPGTPGSLTRAQAEEQLRAGGMTESAIAYVLHYAPHAADLADLSTSPTVRAILRAYVREQDVAGVGDAELAALASAQIADAGYRLSHIEPGDRDHVAQAVMVKTGHDDPIRSPLFRLDTEPLLCLAQRLAREVCALRGMLAARAPADASLEARATAAKDIYDATVDGPTDEADLRGWLAVVRAVDASRPKAPTERTFPRVILGSVAPGSLIEIVSGDIGLVLDGCYGEAPRYVAWVATGHVDTMPADATVSLRATPAELDALTSADASRPGLTEEQARELARAAILGANGGCAIVDRVAAGYLRASRSEPGPAPVVCGRCQTPRANGRCLCGGPGDEGAWLPGDRGYPTPGRGETGPAADPLADLDRAERALLAAGGWEELPDVSTSLSVQWRDARGSAADGGGTTWNRGTAIELERSRRRAAKERPAPTWGEQAIAEHHRAAQPEPFEKIEQLPSGLTCPGCYAATGIAQPHDPRATLHDGDPQKTATLAGDGTGND